LSAGNAARKEAMGTGLGERDGAAVSKFWSDRARICNKELPCCHSVFCPCFLHMAVSEKFGRCLFPNLGFVACCGVLWSFSEPLPPCHCFQLHLQA